MSLPVSVIVPVRNEAHNLSRRPIPARGGRGLDPRALTAPPSAAKVVQFHYAGWPKKRQWAMDTLPLACDWVFLMDADEALTPELAAEMRL